MFGSKTRTIRVLQGGHADLCQRLEKSRKDARTHKFNFERLLARVEVLEAENAAQRSKLDAQGEERPAGRVSLVKRTSDATGARIRAKGQPVDLADELARARAHAAALEERLAVLQAANERMFWGLDARRRAAAEGTEPSPAGAEPVVGAP